MLNYCFPILYGTFLHVHKRWWKIDEFDVSYSTRTFFMHSSLLIKWHVLFTKLISLEISNAQSLRISLGAFFVAKWINPDGRSIFTVNALLLASCDKYSSA